MAATQETQATQGRTDPRRLGRNNSGLTEQDVSDVVCILHPSSPAAFRIVSVTAQRNAQHVLQNQGLYINDHRDTGIIATEADTILLPSTSTEGPRDLALRFSAHVSDPTVGFCFGRNPFKCDINLDPEENQRRVSNTHFRIFINDNGVLMLEDMSTNGTVVDGMTIGGKKHANANPKAKMLQHGSIIEILSPNADDVIKFISREPARDNFTDQYALKFQAYMEHVKIARRRAEAAEQGKMPEAAARAVMAAPLAGPVNTKVIPNPPPPAMSSRSPMHWDGGGRYNCVGLLGKGAFATVYQIATTFSGEYFAAKELEKRRFVKNGQLDQRLDNEMTIMKQLRHDNIVQYIEYIETKNHLYIIMEYIPGGDLQGYTQSHGTLPEDLARGMTAQILDALHYLHKRDITHRDIKPDNILICSETPFTVKLTDFGLSKVVKNNETFLKTFCGTLLYCAPEVFPHYDNYISGSGGRPKKRKANVTRRSYSQLVDIWSYAAVLWTALCGKPPFEGVVDANGKGMFEKIMSSPVDKSSLVEYGVSDDACDLLLLMLDTDPSQRPSEAECLRHPWLNGGVWLADPAPEAEGDMALDAIAEDEEGAEELDASQLNIEDHSEDLPDNKRVKQQYQALRTQSTEGDTEPGLDYEMVPLNDAIANEQATKPPKLFGEISQTAPGPALQSSGALTGQPDQPHGPDSMNDSSNDASGYGDSRILDIEHEMTEDQSISNGVHQQEQNEVKQEANTSLSGAESMVRELHMASPRFGNSAVHTPENPQTPVDSHHTPDSSAPGMQPKQQEVRPSQEKTPKPRKFDRRIELPITASSYYDPFDPRTHNVEYASNVSGHNFRLEPSTSIAGVTSLPEKVHQSFHSGGSSRSHRSQSSLEGSWEELRNGEQHDDQHHDEHHDEHHAQAQEAPITVAPVQQYSSTPPDLRKRHSHPHAPNVPSPLSSASVSNGASAVMPPPSTIAAKINAASISTSQILAVLRSTPQSFLPISLPLQLKTTTWGRYPTCDIRHPDPGDTRVPKVGLELVFDSVNFKDGSDWRSAKGLQLLVLTHGRNGVKVNGVRLQERGKHDGRLYGRLADGDEVEIFMPKVNKNGESEVDAEEKGLTFVVEFHAENLKWRRRKGEVFTVMEQRVPASAGTDATGSHENGRGTAVGAALHGSVAAAS